MKHSRVPAPLKRLVIATANAGKLREFQALLAGLPFVARELVGRLAWPLPRRLERRFAENALAEGPSRCAASGAAAIADDSGLEVDALGGAPGIFSARYAGEGAGDAANNAKLIAALRGVRGAERSLSLRARVCRRPCRILRRCARKGFGKAASWIPREAAAGFGYDPYFWIPELEATAAELEPERKNRLSHRGQALRALRAALAAGRR